MKGIIVCLAALLFLGVHATGGKFKTPESGSSKGKYRKPARTQEQVDSVKRFLFPDEPQSPLEKSRMRTLSEGGSCPNLNFQLKHVCANCENPTKAMKECWSNMVFDGRHVNHVMHRGTIQDSDYRHASKTQCISPPAMWYKCIKNGRCTVEGRNCVTNHSPINGHFDYKDGIVCCPHGHFTSQNHCLSCETLEDVEDFAFMNLAKYVVTGEVEFVSDYDQKVPVCTHKPAPFFKCTNGKCVKIGDRCVTKHTAKSGNIWNPEGPAGNFLCEHDELEHFQQADAPEEAVEVLPQQEQFSDDDQPEDVDVQEEQEQDEPDQAGEVEPEEEDQNMDNEDDEDVFEVVSHRKKRKH